MIINLANGDDHKHAYECFGQIFQINILQYSI